MQLEDQLRSLMGEKAPEAVSQGTALGTGMADGYDLYDSPVGTVVVTFNPDGVSSVWLASDDYEGAFHGRFGRALIRAEAPKAWAARIPEGIEAGTPGRLPVDLRSVTDFQAEVLLRAASIPRGEVRSYGWVARQVGRESAVRAVGSTMARNPVPLIIPCHRVVRSDGRIGAYSLGGPHQKWELLTVEGADPNRLEALANAGVRVQANRSTGVFCHPTCRAIRRSKSDNVVGYPSSDEAAAAGFRACQLCRPA